MHWIFFAISSILCLATANILQKTLMKNEDSDALSYSIIFQVTCTIIVGSFAYLRGFVLPPVAQMPINFILMGILYGLGTIMSFKALKYLGSSEVTIIAASRSIITIISAIVLLDDPFNLQKAVGALLIIVAVVAVSKKENIFVVNKGILHALGYALCFGLAVTNDAFIVRRSDAFSFTAMSFLMPSIFLFILKPSVIKNIKHFLNPTVFRNMFLFSLFYSAAGISFYSALSKGANASQMSPINQAAVIVTVMLAALFLKERNDLVKKIICAVIVVVGVWLLA